MAEGAPGYLIRQFDTAWALADLHLTGLTTAECLWRPATRGLHVRQDPEGRWIADWPEHEAYDLGPPSIAWLTWHMLFWWSSALDHALGEGRLTRHDVVWPGDAEGVRTGLASLQGRWRDLIVGLEAEDLHSTARTRWPFRERPFGDVVAWANIELAKNAAEIGYARFLYAVRGPDPA